MPQFCEKNLQTFHFCNLHPQILIGSASDRYAGWLSQIYSHDRYQGRITKRTKIINGKSFIEEVLPVESVEEYCEHFPVLEIFGVEAHIYGYPLVTMEMTRWVLTNVAKPEGKAAPMSQLLHMRAYPTPAAKQVTAPNADTLYSIAWLDLAKEPYVLSLPDECGRYYLMPMLSAWTDVFQVSGTRTTGTKAQKYAITGPGRQGTLPAAGVTEYKSPTNMVWILGRTYRTGTAADYKTVHKLPDQYKLVPLSVYAKPFTPPPGKVDPSVDMKTPVREQVNRMDAGLSSSSWTRS